MSDTDLIRYLHGELEDGERARVDARIGASAATAERVRVLQHREARLLSLLGTVDPHADEIEVSALRIRQSMADARRREHSGARGSSPLATRILTHEHWWRRIPPSFRVAAATAAMLGVLMLVEPARAWVVMNARAVAVAIGLIDDVPLAPVPDAPATDPVTQMPRASARLAFPWTAGAIVIDAGNVRGTITVRRGTAGRVTAEVAVSENATDANTIVTPDGLRFEGGAAVRVNAVITVPASLRTIRVDSRGTSTTYTMPADGSELRIGLE